MPVAGKNKKTTTTTRKRAAAKKMAGVIVTDAVGNYEKHPFFVKKANAAKALLSKVGLPEDFKVKTV